MIYVLNSNFFFFRLSQKKQTKHKSKKSYKQKNRAFYKLIQLTQLIFNIRAIQAFDFESKKMLQVV